MREKLKDDKFAKDLLYKFIFALALAIVALLLLNVLSMNKDGRSQIIDENGAEEVEQTNGMTSEEMRLATVLSQINGVGSVQVMISYRNQKTSDTMFYSSDDADTGEIRGVIVTATGAGSSVVKHDIKSAVSTLFDIPTQKVIVFEKNEEGL